MVVSRSAACSVDESDLNDENQPLRESSRLLGIDVGRVRVGVAKSILGIIAPLVVLDRAQSKAEKEILRLASSESIDGIVIGLPLSDDGSENQQCLDIYAFVNRLKKRTTIPIVFQDEFLSSFETGGYDAKAAALILQRFTTKVW